MHTIILSELYRNGCLDSSIFSIKNAPGSTNTLTFPLKVDLDYREITVFETKPQRKKTKMLTVSYYFTLKD